MNPAYFAIMDGLFNSIESNSIRVVTSPVTLAECLILPIRQKALLTNDAQLKRIPDLRVVVISELDV